MYCPRWGSNSRPSDYETDALPTALRRLHSFLIIAISTLKMGRKTKKKEKSLRWPGIEPGSTAWKAAMLTTIPPTPWWFLTFEGRTTNNSSIWCTYPPLYLKIMETPWRNGSASDSRSEGCVFESRRGHNFISKMFIFCLSNNAINSSNWFYFCRLVSLDGIEKISLEVRHQNLNYPKYH